VDVILARETIKKDIPTLEKQISEPEKSISYSK